MMATRASKGLPLALALLGIAIPLIGSGFAVWGLAVLWATIIAVVFIVAYLTRPAPPVRVFAGFIGLTLLFYLAYEGGWWFIPAVLVKMAIDARAARTARGPHADAG